MTLKKLAIFGAAIGGAAYLSNKQRRDRLMESANGFLGQARQRFAEVKDRVEQSAQERTMRAGTQRDAGPRDTGIQRDPGLDPFHRH